MKTLQAVFAERLLMGLSRNAITTASKWAETYRVLGGGSFPGPWRFTHHPWLKEMHDSEAPLNVGQKAAQVGFTEALLNRVFFNIDIKKWDCLYLLPAQKPDAADFTASRFDPALEASDHLSKIFSEVKNLHHKRAGSVNLYVRGSRSKSQLKSIPVNFIAFDEVEEMELDNIPLAMERMSGQIEKMAWMISTPRIDNIGINKYYRMTTQEKFFFKCPSCSKRIEFKFPDNIVITADDIRDPKVKDSYYVCNECKNELPQKAKRTFLQTGEWVPTHPGPDARGFNLNQMYSPAITPGDLALAYLKSLSDPTEESEFFNSKLGITHTVDGARLDDAIIEECIMPGHRRQNDYPGGNLVTMGVDVGTFLNIEIDEWFLPGYSPGLDVNSHATCKVLWYGKLKDFDELPKLMLKYKVVFCVIDANPETRKAQEFAAKIPGRIKLCFYSRGAVARNIYETKGLDTAISVDRTSWLDMSLGRFKKGKKQGGIILPLDIDLEYKANLTNIVRIYEKDADGNPIGRYVNGSSPDHYAHSRNYAEIALPLALGFGPSKNIAGGVL